MPLSQNRLTVCNANVVLQDFDAENFAEIWK